MKITDYLAIWGAFIGTVVAAWNIYKDFIKRDRVKVTAGFRIQFPPRQEVFVYQVTNLSSHKISVTHCVMYSGRIFHSKLLRRHFQRFRWTGTGHVGLTTLDGQRLPIGIEPWNNHIFTFMIVNFPIVEDVSIITADGREWFCPRRDIKTIHADHTYKAIRAKAKGEDGV